MHTSSMAYKIALILFSAILFAPILKGWVVNSGEKRGISENRTLSAMPTFRTAVGSPRKYLNNFQEFMKDRMAFISEATSKYNYFVFNYLNVSPRTNISINRPYIFFTSHSKDSEEPDNIISASQLANPKKTFEAISRIEKIVAQLTVDERRVIVSIAPTKPVLYGDRLPPLLPSWLKKTCDGLVHGNNMLDKLIREYDRTSIVYPFQEMLDKRDQEQFYPPEQFHFEGRSAHLMAKRTLEAMGILLPNRFDLEPKLSQRNSDLSRVLGFNSAVSYWKYDYTLEFGMTWEDRKPDIVKEYHTRASDYRYFKCKNPITERKALVLGDSFSGVLAFYLYPAYREMISVSFNDITAQDMKGFRGLIDVYDPDDIYLILHDQGIFGWIPIMMEEQWQDTKGSKT